MERKIREKQNDPAVQQIIDRILQQHFSKDQNRPKTIGEMEEEIVGHIVKKAKVVDFGNGENCEFN